MLGEAFRPPARSAYASERELSPGGIRQANAFHRASSRTSLAALRGEDG